MPPVKNPCVMTSYGGITRIRSRVEVRLLPLSLHNKLPCICLLSVLYTGNPFPAIGDQHKNRHGFWQIFQNSASEKQRLPHVRANGCVPRKTQTNLLIPGPQPGIFTFWGHSTNGALSGGWKAEARQYVYGRNRVGAGTIPKFDRNV